MHRADRVAAEQQQSSGRAEAADQRQQISARMPKKVQGNSSKHNNPADPQEMVDKSDQRPSNLNKGRASIVEIV